MIKHEPHSNVKIEDESYSNLAVEFKMSDPDSGWSESENFNMAENYAETVDFFLAGTVKIEPII